jgi:cytoskeletal protein RodZ
MTAILIGVIVLVLVAAALGGFLFFRNRSDDTTTAQPKASNTPQSSSAPTSAAPTPSTGASNSAGDKLASRSTDPKPLALTELSKPTYNLSTSGAYTRSGQDQGADCAKSVDGAAVALVAKLKCSQVTSVTAVNAKTGCVDTFGALNFPDATTASQAEAAIKGGKAGSFVPRRHNVAAEGQAGRKDWWFYRKAYGHWLVFSTGAYASGKVAAKDKVIDTCAQDFLYSVIETLDKR